MQNQIEAMHSLYRIGAVSRLTGIPTDTLRIWERRYELVKPQRTEKGGRLYSQDDVTRLTMIKSLVDRGHAIGTVARLDLQELRNRLAQSGAHNPAELVEGHARLCIAGEALSIRVRHAQNIPEGIDVVGVYSDLQHFLEDENDCDTLIIELPFMDHEIVRRLQDANLRNHAHHLVVVYAFAPSAILRQLQRLRVETERAPVTLEHLWQRVLGASSTTADTSALAFDPDVITSEPAPPRLFSNTQLANLSQITTTLKCECPHHMSGIIETLVAFEEYSTRCENQTTQDAALHAYLHVMTAKARWLMEIALEKLAEVEDIDTSAQD